MTRMFLETGARPSGHIGPLILLGDTPQLREVWSVVGESLLDDWVSSHPCTRPWAWWHLEAMEPRRRTGGIGAALHAVLAVEPRLCFQIPQDWVTPDHERFFGVGPAVDQDMPPRHESQAAYLQRLGLLSVDELQYLSTHCDLLNDEVLQP